MTKDEELSRYMLLIEQYKDQINQLEMQYSYLNAAITDYNRAKLTLENLSNAEKGSEVLLPIGGSTFINANAIDPSKAFFDIGTGLVAEKNAEDAIKKIDKRIEKLQKTQEKLIETVEKLQNEAAEISAKAQGLMSEEK